MYANIQFTKPFCFGKKFVTLAGTAHAKTNIFAIFVHFQTR